MGFASGGPVAEQLWQRLKKAGLLPKESHRRQQVAEIIVDEFETLDTDDWEICPGSLYATARPDEVEDEGDEEEDEGFDDYDEGPLDEEDA